MARLIAVAVTSPASNAATVVNTAASEPGDRVVIVAVGKANTTSQPTINQGFTIVGFGNGGTGLAGADVGNMFSVVFAKDMTDTESAPTITPGAINPNTWLFYYLVFRLDEREQWADLIAGSAPWIAFVSDTSTASPLTGSTTFSPQVRGGDQLVAVGGIPTDNGTAVGASSIAVTGLTADTPVTAGYTETTLGNDMAMAYVSEGLRPYGSTATGVTTPSFVFTSASNHSGVITLVAMRVERNAPAPRMLRQAINRAGVY